MQTKIKNTLTKKPLLTLLLSAFLIRFLLAYFMPLSINPDQIFQTLEPAHYLAFGRGFLAWEWHNGIRSWAYPGFLAGIMKLCSYISSSPRFYISTINIIMISFSLLPVYITYKLTYESHKFLPNKQELSLLAALLPAFWYTLIIYAPLTLNGTLPAYLFALNCYLIIKYIDVNNNITKENAYSLILIGSIFGLVAILRFHLLPEIAFAMLYCSRKNFVYRAKFLTIGFLLTFMPLGFLDWITWGYPFHSIVYNFYINIFQGVATDMGVKPFYYYLGKNIQHWNIFFIPFCYFAYLGFKKHPIFIWIALINLVSFSLIAHKEFRFIFLFIICFFISSGMGVAEFYASLSQNKLLNKKIKNISKENFLKIYICSLLIFIFIAFLTFYSKYKDQSLGFMLNLNNVIDKKLNNQVSKIFQFHTDKDAYCGGGYSYLNLDVPYNYQNYSKLLRIKVREDSEKFLTKNESNLERAKVIITDKDKPLIGGQELICDNKFCAYAYFDKVNKTRYYLWKILPFYL
jgi:GPI mannosyltransferase 3